MIDGLTEDLRQIYETTENEFNFQVQKGIKNGWTKTKLKVELTKANKRSLKLINRVYPSMVEQTKKINERLYKSALKQFSLGIFAVKKLSVSLGLRESIEKVTKQGIDSDLKVKVGGKTWTYKSYMEMKARSTVQYEIGEEQLKNGKGNVIFYVCDHFADCADDHKDFQGKVYYDERWKSWDLSDELKKRVRQRIKERKMLSVQEVKDNDPYLTTRPNCRHRFNPISINDGLDKSGRTLVKEKQLTRGSYKPKNYKNLQQQRYNERMIRKYKGRAESSAKLGLENKEAKRLTRKWQGIQREHIKANPELQRDYRRESNKILINDLGVKYNK